MFDSRIMSNNKVCQLLQHFRRSGFANKWNCRKNQSNYPTAKNFTLFPLLRRNLKDAWAHFLPIITSFAGTNYTDRKQWQRWEISVFQKVSESGYEEKEKEPAFSRTVLDQIAIVYTARMIAPAGSIHQESLSPRTAAANPTTLVTTSK